MDEIPGIARRGAERIIAETGYNMEQFPSVSHFCSWAGLVPENSESAGKRKSTKIRKGNKYLRTIMVEVALAGIRNKNTFWYAKFTKIAPRRGGKKAVIAVAHSMLISIYYMLKNMEHYHDLGADYYKIINEDKIKKRYIKNLSDLGYNVILTPSS